MDVDDVYTTYAEFGLYQQQVFALVTSFQAFLALHQVHNIFVGATPEFLCLVKQHSVEGCPRAEDGQAGSCDQVVFRGGDFTSIVSEWVFKSSYKSSLVQSVYMFAIITGFCVLVKKVTTWKLVCSQSYKASLVQSVYMFGILTGCIVFGKLADRYGRKAMLCLSALGMTLFSLLGMVARDYRFYVAMRYVTAFFNGGAGLVSFVLLAELIGSSKRSLAGVVVPMCFGLGISLYALLAHIFRTWRVLTGITALPGLVAIFWFWFLPESPRWLYSQGRLFEAEQVLEQIIARNGEHTPAKPIALRQKNSPAESGLTKSSAGSEEAGGGYQQLLKVPLLRNLTLNNAFTWSMNCCAYYGLTMGAGDLGGNMYTSVALSGLVEIPAYITTHFLIESKLGRRLSFSGTMLLGGIVCALMLIVPTEFSGTRTGIALAGKMIVSTSFSIAWLYSAEIYPTRIRNQGVSVCVGSSRVGGMVAPLVLHWGHIIPNFEYLVFGVGLFISGVLALKLPETRQKRMPETLQDLYDLYKGQRSRPVVEVKGLSEDKVKLLQRHLELRGEESSYEEEFEIVEEQNGSFVLS